MKIDLWKAKQIVGQDRRRREERKCQILEISTPVAGAPPPPP